MSEMDIVFNEAFSVLVKCCSDIDNIDIKKFNEAYKKLKKTFTLEDKLRSLNNSIEQKLKGCNYDGAIEDCNRIIKTINSNKLTSNF